MFTVSRILRRRSETGAGEKINNGIVLGTVEEIPRSRQTGSDRIQKN